MTDEMTEHLQLRHLLIFIVPYDYENDSATFKYDYGDEFNKSYGGPINPRSNKTH